MRAGSGPRHSAGSGGGAVRQSLMATPEVAREDPVRRLRLGPRPRDSLAPHPSPSVVFPRAPREAARPAAPRRRRGADGGGPLARDPSPLPPHPRARRGGGRRALGPARARAPLLRTLAARLSRAALRPDAGATG